jgi:hypothetical protein
VWAAGDLDALPLPADLGDLYQGFLNRRIGVNRTRWRDEVRPVLGLVAVSQGGGLSHAQLDGVTGKHTEGTLEEWKQYLGGALPDGPFRPFHKSFADFLLDEPRNRAYHVDAAGMHERLVDHYWPAAPHDAPGADPAQAGNGAKAWAGWDAYARRYLPTHLAGAARGRPSAEGHPFVERLVSLVADVGYQDEYRVDVKDLAALQGDLERTMRAAAADLDPVAVVLLAQAAFALVDFRRRELRPEPLFELARAGDVDAAAARLDLFEADQRWRETATLALGWLGADVNPQQAQRALDRLPGLTGPRWRLAAHLHAALGGQPVPPAQLEPPEPDRAPWSRASTRTAAFVAACASVRYSDDQRLPSRAYGWLVYPPPANAARCEDWLLLVYALYTYLLADKPDWSALGPTLITAVQEVDDEMLAQSASIALAAFLEVRSDTFSAAEIRGVLSAATLLCRRWPDNKTTVIAAADLAVLAARRLSRDLQDVEGLAASAPVLEEVTRVDLSQSSSFLGQQLSELRLRALAMLARAPWPSGLAPLEEIQRIRQAFPATRGILGAAATAVAALAADDRVLAEGLAAERQAVDAALAACDSIDETIGRLRALLGFGRDAQSPPTLNELVAVRRRHGRSRALHEALAEALKKDRPAWPQADLAAERQAIAETLAAGDFDPPDSDMTLRRFLHEHRLQYRTPG